MSLLEKLNGGHDLRHWLIVMIVFGITGFSALVFSRLLFNVILGMEGSLWSGPWTYQDPLPVGDPAVLLGDAGRRGHHLRKAGLLRLPGGPDVEPAGPRQSAQVVRLELTSRRE